MLYAIGSKGEKIRAARGVAGCCPSCGEGLIAKCGDIKIHHWAHKADGECDDWSEPESDWHLYWKSLVPPAHCEVVIQRESIRHRADIVTTTGKVIELQHSQISPQEIAEREKFYRNMVWLFDVQECCINGSARDGRARLMFTFKGDYHKFRWKHARQHIGLTDYKKIPVYLDTGAPVETARGERPGLAIFRLKDWRVGPPTRGWGKFQTYEDFQSWVKRSCIWRLA